MPRRARVTKRTLQPDAKYRSMTVTMFVNKIMEKGKKNTSEGIVYDALDIIQAAAKRDPIEVLDQALKNAIPALEVRPRRVGGATYQVPVEVRVERANALAIRWLLGSARARGGKSMAEKLANEIQDAARGQGAAIKKREDTHKMAEANRAFVHYRW